MLQATIIVMTIMGCGNDGLSCDFVAEASRQWASKEECSQAIPDALLTVGATTYPVLTASCDAKITQAEAFPVPSPEEPVEPETDLEPIVLGADLQEDRKPAMYRLKDGYALVFDETADAIGKFGDGVRETYSFLKDAVKLSLEEIAETTGRSLRKVGEIFDGKKQ